MDSIFEKVLATGGLSYLLLTHLENEINKDMDAGLRSYAKAYGITIEEANEKINKRIKEKREAEREARWY